MSSSDEFRALLYLLSKSRLGLLEELSCKWEWIPDEAFLVLLPLAALLSGRLSSAQCLVPRFQLAPYDQKPIRFFATCCSNLFLQFHLLLTQDVHF
ncbi:hypothetical protein PoB_006535900 [Plakobranchus ocellatus]|uniref:Uncharacterized protein n=1 Tax=Plakobranchus ocellatus TaxID=259542 RepID=A0AAV4D3Y4_9GAST|nr:hypothetical protein PoB_006535900 [Plakobranchus ocellatus]